jgi:hypothetical protein
MLSWRRVTRLEHFDVTLDIFHMVRALLYCTVYVSRGPQSILMLYWISLTWAGHFYVILDDCCVARTFSMLFWTSVTRPGDFYVTLDMSRGINFFMLCWVSVTGSGHFVLHWVSFTLLRRFSVVIDVCYMVRGFLCYNGCHKVQAFLCYTGYL